MTVTPTPIFPQSLVNAVQTIANSDGTTVKTLITAGTNGTKIESLNVTSSDTSARDVVLYATISSTNYPLAIVQIPATAGTADNVVSVDILRHSQWPALAYDANGNKYLYLASGAALSVAAGSTVTSGKQLTLFVQGGNY